MTTRTCTWVDANLGSKLTMKFPSIYLLGPEAHGEILSIAFAGKGQHQDAGGKIIHGAPKTTSSVFAKSVSKDGGRGSYRGLLEVAKGATEAKSKVVCDALLLDKKSRSDLPVIGIEQRRPTSATRPRCRGRSSSTSRPMAWTREASKMIVNGFIEPITKELPMEYAVEMNRLMSCRWKGRLARDSAASAAIADLIG